MCLDTTEKKLLEIKRGEWGLERVKKEAERLFKRAEEAYDRCTLPNEPNTDEVEYLVTRITYEQLM